MIAGRDAPTHGEAKNSWLTGTAAWNYVAVTQWILGIRPEYDGLRVEPVLPQAWPGFRAARTYRGVRYQIQVERGSKEAAGLSVDGRKVAGNLIPLSEAGIKEVDVRLVLG